MQGTEYADKLKACGGKKIHIGFVKPSSEMLLLVVTSVRPLYCVFTLQQSLTHVGSPVPCTEKGVWFVTSIDNPKQLLIRLVYVVYRSGRKEDDFHGIPTRE